MYRLAGLAGRRHGTLNGSLHLKDSVSFSSMPAAKISSSTSPAVEALA
jgi:hypothetical protein